MFAHRVANNFTSWYCWLKLHRFGWKTSHDDSNKAALHALKLAHDGVRRHLCRRTNPHSCRKTNPTGAKMKNCSKESTCRSFGSWCMVYIRSSNEGAQETNDEARNESVVLKVCTSHLKYLCPYLFFYIEKAETPRQMIFQERESSRALHNVRRKITSCYDCLHILIRRRHSNFELVWLLFSRRRIFEKNPSWRSRPSSLVLDPF